MPPRSHRQIEAVTVAVNGKEDTSSIRFDCILRVLRTVGKKPSMFSTTLSVVKLARSLAHGSVLFSKYRQNTMISYRGYLGNILAARKARAVDGCVVECGVWRGGMIAGIAELLGAARTYYLLDSFEGLPPATEVDGQTAIAWQKNTSGETYYDNCSAEPEFAINAMKRSGAKAVNIVKGFFADTIKTVELDEPVALLRLDGDWYESTMVCLENFFPKVAPGGIVIIDDYGVWDGCTKAVHDYLSAHKRPEAVRTNAFGVSYLQKQFA